MDDVADLIQQKQSFVSTSEFFQLITHALQRVSILESSVSRSNWFSGARAWQREMLRNWSNGSARWALPQGCKSKVTNGAGQSEIWWATPSTSLRACAA